MCTSGLRPSARITGAVGNQGKAIARSMGDRYRVLGSTLTMR